MGVYDSLAEMKEERKKLTDKIKSDEALYRESQRKLRDAETALRRAKKERNKRYNDWKKARSDLAFLVRKIKSFPSQVRRRVKDKPFEAFDKRSTK